MDERQSVTNRDMARGLGSTLLARLGSIVEILAQPVYIHLFGLATYGLYSALWAAINLVENIADLGVTTALQRTIPQAVDERQATTALRAAMLIGMIPCLALAILFSAGAPWFTHIFNASPANQDELVLAIRLFAWALPLWAFVEIATSALRARRTFGPEIRLRVMWEQLTRLGGACIFFLISPSIIALLAAHLLSLAVVSLLCARLLSRYFDLRFLLSPGAKGQLRETFEWGLSSLPSNIITRLFSDGPPVLLNVAIPGTAGATASGLYTIARKLSSVVLMIRNASSYVISPLAASAHRQKEDIIRLYRYASRLIVAVVLPLGIVAIGGAGILIDLFGNSAEAAYAPLIILVAARTIETMMGPATAVLLVIGGYRQRLLGSGVALAVAAALSAWLLPAGGATSAALAVGVGMIAGALVSFIQLWAKQRVHPFDGAFAATILRAGLIAAAAGAMAALAGVLPAVPRAVLLLLLVPGAIWLSMRLSLPADDRATLGKTGRRLRLVTA